MAVEDLITFDEPRARLAELDDIRSLAERELRALRNHEELICKLEADRDTLLESLVGVAQDALNSLTGEERHHVFKMLKLGAIVGPGEVLEVSGAFGEKFTMRDSKTPRVSRSQVTQELQLRFHALLTDVAREVRFERVPKS
jgi:hypothetical protein